MSNFYYYDPNDRINNLANKLLEEGRIDELEKELMRFDPQKLEGKEKESWYHTWGLEAFRRGKYEEAFKRFSEGFSACPDSGFIAFMLGRVYEQWGQIDRMIEMFDAFPFPQVPSEYAMAQARFAYLWNKIEKAIQYVMPILNYYYELGKADSHFLAMKHFPLFDEIWSSLGTFFELTGNLSELRVITAKAQRRFTDYEDFDYFYLVLDCIEKNDYNPLIALNERNATVFEEQGWSSGGYFAMKAAIIKSQKMDDIKKAEQILFNVKLSKDDFRWLGDIRLLAQCALANKAKDQQREEKLVEQFLERQPYLFEPDNVFNFRLVGYQEKVKLKYQERKKHPEK